MKAITLGHWLCVLICTLSLSGSDIAGIMSCHSDLYRVGVSIFGSHVLLLFILRQKLIKSLPADYSKRDLVYKKIASMYIILFCSYLICTVFFTIWIVGTLSSEYYWRMRSFLPHPSLLQTCSSMFPKLPVHILYPRHSVCFRSSVGDWLVVSQLARRIGQLSPARRCTPSGYSTPPTSAATPRRL